MAAVLTKWQLDPVHSTVGFSVKHMMFTTVRGRFSKVEGTILVDEMNPNNSRAEVNIDAASIDTGVPDRDNHLRAADFLDVEHYPTIQFRSTRITGAQPASQARAGARFSVTGDLTIRGKSKEVTLDTTYEGTGKDPSGNEKAGFSASAEVDRREWGLVWNQALETGGILVGNTITIEVEVQAVKS